MSKDSISFQTLYLLTKSSFPLSSISIAHLHLFSPSLTSSSTSKKKKKINMTSVSNKTTTSDELAALKYEHDSLSLQVSQLASALARRRADLALMRGEAATVAMSLESAKHNLDSVLRAEKNIRAGAPPSPHARTSVRADFLPDVGLVRALTGQLEVTKKSVRETMQRRDELAKEIATLKAHVMKNTTSNSGDDGKLSNGDDQKNNNAVPVVGNDDDIINNNLVVDTKSIITDKNITINNNDPSQQQQSLVQREERRRSNRVSVERSLLRVLEDGATCRSSFRLDHARIWRDSTMPNVILADKDEETFIPGVVTERIFEGVTCFTQTADSEALMIDIRLDYNNNNNNNNNLKMRPLSDIDIDFLQKPQGRLRARVIDHYATLSSSTTSSSALRIIAPRFALARVRKLVLDATRRASGNVIASSTPASIMSRPGIVDKDISGSMAAVSLSSPSGLNERPKKDDDDDEDEERNNDEEIGKNGKSSKTTKDQDGDIKSQLKVVEDEEEVDDDDDDGDKVELPLPKRKDSSSVLTDTDFGRLMGIGVPARFHECTLSLLYSTELHGMSLRTLYNKCRSSSPTIIAIRDTHDRVFGCYAAQPWRASATRYYGTGESFVFGQKRDKIRVFKWSRSNSLFQFTSSSFLSIGGGAGSHFALWVDEELFMGTTASCSTFDSPPLTQCSNKMKDDQHSNEFKILVLEVWGLVTTGRM